MSHYVQIIKHNRSIGELRWGKCVVRPQGTRYPSLSQAKIAARRFLVKYPTLSCVVKNGVTGAVEGMMFGELPQDPLVKLLAAAKNYGMFQDGEHRLTLCSAAVNYWRSVR